MPVLYLKVKKMKASHLAAIRRMPEIWWMNNI